MGTGVTDEGRGVTFSEIAKEQPQPSGGRSPGRTPEEEVPEGGKYGGKIQGIGGRATENNALLSSVGAGGSNH